MADRIKVLMGVPRPHLGGGPPTHLPHLVGYFGSREGFRLRTFWFGRRSDKGENGLLKILNTLTTLLAFLWHLVSFRPQIIHLNTAFDKRSVVRDIPFLLLARATGIPALVKLHGSLPGMVFPAPGPWVWARNMFLAAATRICLLSRKERDEFLSVYPHPGKIPVVKNILLPREGEKDIGRRSGGLFVSRMLEEKGAGDLIEALPMILQRVPGFRIVVAGDGPFLEEAKRRSAASGCDRAVHWTGQMQHKALRYLYDSAMIFIFCSRLPEGMPMALAEALVAGIPVVTTPVRFAHDYLQEGVNCLYYPAGEPGKLAEAVIRLAEDPELQKTMSLANRDLVRQFTREVVGKEFENIYHEMLV